MITSDEMIVSCVMIRMLGGMLRRSRLTARLEPQMTKSTASVMTNAVSIFVVTARAEQIPST